jgi:hypothetical protein
MFRISSPLCSGMKRIHSDSSNDAYNTLPRNIESLEEVGPVLYAYLRHGLRTEKILSAWQASFGVTHCPMCLNSPDGEGSERIGQTHPASSIAEWGSRALGRLRCEPLSKEHVTVTLGEGDLVIEELFAFDSHIVRHMLSLDDDSFSATLCDLRCIRPAGGKSAARFASSTDGSFILKSISGKEEEFFRSSAPILFEYMKDVWSHKKASVLIPVLGAFTVKSRKNKLSFLVMPNIASSQSAVLFDLKGVVKRACKKLQLSPAPLSGKHSEHELISQDDGTESVPERDTVSPLPGLEVLWDEEFRQWCDIHQTSLEDASFQFLSSALYNDTNLLASLNVIDYSLFTAIEPGYDGHPPVMNVGIIDFLRPFTWDKKLESVVKTVNNNLAHLGTFIKGTDGLMDSKMELGVAPTVIRPELYARRFCVNIIAQFDPSYDSRQSIS